MGRLSAPLLQAVCFLLVGSMRGQQIYIKLFPIYNREISWKQPLVLKLWILSSLFVLCDVYQKLLEEKELTVAQQGHCLFLTPWNKCYNKATKNKRSITWNMKKSIFSYAVMWVVGYLLHHQWHLKDALRCCADNTYEPAHLPGCKVRVERHLVFLSLCSSGWCRQIGALRDICLLPICLHSVHACMGEEGFTRQSKKFWSLRGAEVN